MRLVDDLVCKLEELIASDNLETRKEIARICDRFLDADSSKFVRLKREIQRVIEQLGVMEDVGRRKEARVIHMDLEEIKMLLERLKEIRGEKKTPLNTDNC
jgi:hypothetical protein